MPTLVFRSLNGIKSMVWMVLIFSDIVSVSVVDTDFSVLESSVF
ncbi:hypothetical protein ACFFF1_01580 [Listeria seeligeri]|nr:hypothetical protein [Listeria seeligeri]